MLALRQMRPWSKSSPDLKISRRAQSAKIATTKTRPLSQRRFGRSYSNDVPEEGKTPEMLSPDMTLPDFGMPQVTLDSQKYYEAFGNTDHFIRPSVLAWDVWHPPASVIQPEEWLSIHETSGARSIPSASTIVRLMGSVSSRVADPKLVKEGVHDAFLSVTENMDSGNLEALKDALDPSIFKYLQGWTKYMKDHGYTLNHTIERVLNVEASGICTFETLSKEGDEDPLRKGPFKEGIHISRFGSGQVEHIAALIWAKITAKEKFEILDSKGSLILSSPSKPYTNYWKFGSTSSIPGALFDIASPAFQEENDSQWQFQLLDINHQVINRAAHILTREHLFLDSDVPRYKIWQMTRAL